MSWFKGRSTKNTDGSGEVVEATAVPVPRRSAQEPSGAPQEPLRITHQAPPPPAVAAPLDAVGQQNEMIRVRISHMADRLDEIKSLTDDFAMLAEPLNSFLGEYPQLRSKLFETEALLSRERASTAALRREMDDLGNDYARAADDLAASTGQIRSYESVIQEQEASIEDFRLTLRERSALAENLERQLQAEVERSRAFADENRDLRSEAEVYDQSVSRLRRELGEARDQIGLIENENRRLQQTVEEQASRLAALNSRSVELEQRAEAERQAAAELEARLVAEQVARQKGEAQREAERSAHQTEASNLGMKIDGLTSRLATTEKILAHARDQLAEKTEAWRVAERGLKEALVDRNAFERRLEAAHEEGERQAAHVQDLERARAELIDRCDMFTKALAAKETLVESANSKAAILSNRVEQLIKRFEQDRGDLETANRRLLEELENEKAERLLAQGALNIARESRAKLQKQYATLKRNIRPAAEDGYGGLGAGLSLDDFGAEPEGENNVRRFQPAGKAD